MTALLEYLDLALITRSYFSHWIETRKLNSSKPLKGPSKLINQSMHLDFTELGGAVILDHVIITLLKLASLLL